MFNMARTTLNMDEFRVTFVFLSHAVTMGRFFSLTKRAGTGKNGELSLLLFGCLIRTVSPTLILLTLTPNF